MAFAFGFCAHLLLARRSEDWAAETGKVAVPQTDPRLSPPNAFGRREPWLASPAIHLLLVRPRLGKNCLLLWDPADPFLSPTF